MDGAPQVDAKHPFPVARGGFPEQAGTTHARIVEQQVDRAEAGECIRRECFHGHAIGHIQRALQDIDAVESGDRLRQGIRLHVDQHQRHALLGGDVREFATEAGTRACDHGDLAA